VAIEDSIYALSQPPYPPIPAHELYGDLLMEMNRPAETEKQFAAALKRTPGRPKAIDGLARSAQAQGDNRTATKEYKEFLDVWVSDCPRGGGQSWHGIRLMVTSSRFSRSHTTANMKSDVILNVFEQKTRC